MKYLRDHNTLWATLHAVLTISALYIWDKFQSFLHFFNCFQLLTIQGMELAVKEIEII